MSLEKATDRIADAAGELVLQPRLREELERRASTTLICSTVECLRKTFTWWHMAEN